MIYGEELAVVEFAASTPKLLYDLRISRQHAARGTYFLVMSTRVAASCSALGPDRSKGPRWPRFLRSTAEAPEVGALAHNANPPFDRRLDCIEAGGVLEVQSGAHIIGRRGDPTYIERNDCAKAFELALRRLVSWMAC